MSSRPLSVAILGLNYSPEISGNAPYTASLAEGLRARGYDVRVITTYPHYPAWKIGAEFGGWSMHSQENGVPVERKLHYVPKQPRGVMRLVSELSFGVRLLFARWGRPDVVVLVSPGLFASALAAVRARWGFKRPAIAMWVQDLYSLGIVETGQGGKSLAALMSRAESWVLRGANGVAVIHTRFKEHVIARLGVASEKVIVIRNWSHLETPDHVDRDATRAKLGWRNDEIIVLHAGNMGAKQGLENVVDAARYAAKVGLPVRFVLMGGGNQRRKLEGLSVGLDHITILDPLPNEGFQHALASADVLLVNEKPGIAEMAVPSKLTSYFSTGIPVLAATDEGSATAGELEASGGGIRVDAGDFTALANAANTLARDWRLSQHLGMEGQKFREDYLSESSAIDRYAEWLTSLVAKRGG